MTTHARGILCLAALAALAGCGHSKSEGDTSEDTAVPDLADTVTGDTVEDTVDDTAADPAVDPVEEVVPDVVPDGWPPSCYEPRMGVKNQVVRDVERVIFLGDSITATPYLTPPWSDRIRDDLQGLFGSDVEFQNYAAWGAITDDILSEQLPRIDTTSTKRTLVMFTIGGNDALQVIGQDTTSSLDHMATKVENIRTALTWLYDPANVPGGVYVIFANVYDPTDGEGDFTHCGFGAGLEDWPNCDEVATTANGWYEDLADEFGADLLDLHDLFAGHGYNNGDATNPWYCNECDPCTSGCPRWYDLTCIHPNSDGHEALAGFFLCMVIG
jgi:lysophospholipase L1-like esterase